MKRIFLTGMVIMLITLVSAQKKDQVFTTMFYNVENLFDFSLYKILFRALGVLSLGLICYTSFFTFVGTFLKKSIIFGLIFSFGWESVIQYFPGTTQRFAIAHYIKSLLPSSSSGKFSFLSYLLEPTSPGMAVFMLFLITGGFLVLACLFFSQKEYILDV